MVLNILHPDTVGNIDTVTTTVKRATQLPSSNSLCPWVKMQVSKAADKHYAESYQASPKLVLFLKNKPKKPQPTQRCKMLLKIDHTAISVAQFRLLSWK